MLTSYECSPSAAMAEKRCRTVRWAMPSSELPMRAVSPMVNVLPDPVWP